MLWNQLQEQTVELGWDFYGPVLLFILLVALAVPVWAAIGASAILMLLMSGALPLSLVGEIASFTVSTHFALTAVPLFILTGDVLVRTGPQPKVSRCGRGADTVRQGRLRLGHGAGLRHVRGDFRLGCGRRRCGRADDHRSAGRIRLSATLCLRARRCRCLYRHPYPAVDRLHHHRSGAGHLRIDPVPGRADPGLAILVSILITNIIMNRHLRLRRWRQHGLRGMGGNLGTALKSGWYAFIVPGIIFYGIFSGPPDARLRPVRPPLSSPSSWGSSSAR